ncbi:MULTISPECIES: adenylate/guanylate cyclase domain-containing protein [Paracoccus]|uniref:Adenylate cyclase n=1 Tax=Paracoccus versutus TaxID=34007 RepID=A0A3D9XGP9_PARVE|nr:MULTISPECIES: adenylate/guanylate cyclase domain-containing protein [Paracoccus]REF68748.1 adenylate cyclase [Paracoccus versutus]WGR56921.1 adenylate/guanylate cyclase domain-containing protein [Paracoccus versutus]
MSDSASQPEFGNEQLWLQIFRDGHPVLMGKQRRYRRLPGLPRCKLCFAPFGGWGGWVARRIGLRPSNRNPRFCNACDRFIEQFPGGAEVPISILFCDLRGSVALGERLGAAAYAATVARMRDTVVAALWQHDGFVLEFQGDSVIGVWPPGFSGKDHALKAVAAARSMARTLARQEDAGDDPIRAGIGLHTGTAFLCTFSAASGLLQEVGAFGQAMNIAARLSALAEPGQILATRAVCDAARQAPPPLRQVTLKGIDDPVEITALA